MKMTMMVLVPDNTQCVASVDVIKPSCSDHADAMIDMDDVTLATESEVTESTDQASQTSSSASGDETDAHELNTIVETVAPRSPEEFSTISTQRLGQSPPILWHRPSEPLHKRESKGSWKCLPKPDMEKIGRHSEAMNYKCDDVDEKSIQEGRKKSVVFGLVLIRSYSQTLGDNPSVSYGPPLSLDWEYEEHEAITLDEYEDSRPPRRGLRQMVLNYYHRKNLLSWVYGFSDEELRAAKKQVKREKTRRGFTNALVPIMRMEAALESAARKAKRAFGKNNKKLPSA